MRIGAHTTSNYLARADVAGSRVSDAQDYPDVPKNRDIGDIKQNPFSSSIPNVGPKKTIKRSPSILSFVSRTHSGFHLHSSHLERGGLSFGQGRRA